MGDKKVKMILDRGSYSKDNIDELYKNHQKFIIDVKLRLKYAKQSNGNRNRNAAAKAMYSKKNEKFYMIELYHINPPETTNFIEFRDMYSST